MCSLLCMSARTIRFFSSREMLILLSFSMDRAGCGMAGLVAWVCGILNGASFVQKRVLQCGIVWNKHRFVLIGNVVFPRGLNSKIIGPWMRAAPSTCYARCRLPVYGQVHGRYESGEPAGGQGV